MEKDPDDQFDNAEQRDNGQAQDVADEALERSDDPSEDSERGGTPNPAAIIPDDVPDLVERMDEMVTSGRIDMDAFVGEPVHDDDDDSNGAARSDD